MNKTGDLKEEDLDNIISILQKEKKIEAAYIFGSRAKGNFRIGSDIDIALKGSQLDRSIINHISYLLNEETLMPYKFDIVNYDKIRSSELLSHIDRVGKLLYSRK